MEKYAVRGFGKFLLVVLTFLPAFLFSQNPDTIRVLAVRVEFAPTTAQTITGNGKFDLSVSNDPFQIDPPPHNRSYFMDHLQFLHNYYYKLSGGRLVVIGDVYPLAEDSAYVLDQPMTYYNPNTTPEEINESLAILLRDALQKADEDPDIRFPDYDCFIVFHAGVGKDIDIGFDETPQDIPSLFLTGSFINEYLGPEGIPVENRQFLIPSGIILPETESQEGLQLGLNGMLVANFGSFLGWLDMFSPVTRRSGIGRFGLMDAGLFNGDGLLPALPNPWTRIQAGWENPITLFQAQGDIFQVGHPLSRLPNRVYKVPINEKEYFLIENRYAGEQLLDSLQVVLAAERGYFPNMKEVILTYLPEVAQFSERGVLVDIDNPDRGLPGSGILIWHVDENIIEANRAQNRVNADPEHRGIDVEEADGSQDIGQIFDFLSAGAGSELGTVLDLWYAGNPAPLFKNEFSESSIPNSRSYYRRANSHIKIYDFSRRDSVMTFRAAFNFFQQFFPRKVDISRYGRIASLKTADLNGDGTWELIMTTTQNRVLVMEEAGHSPWGSDSLEVVQLNEPILPPPAIFPLADGSRALVAVTTSGKVYGYRFHPQTLTIDTLFFPFDCGSPVTTPPIVLDSMMVGLAHQAEFDSLPQIFWGCQDGTVWQMKPTDSGWIGEVFLQIPAPVKYLHFPEATSTIIVDENGVVYHDGIDFGEVTGQIYQPAGQNAVSISPDGIFWELLGQQYRHPEDGIFRFDAPFIEVNPLMDEKAPFYLSNGNNRLLVFNRNLTLRENFPVRLEDPHRDIQLPFSPLVLSLPDGEGGVTEGILVTDPQGLLYGFDFHGGRLPDFPLSVGDSIAVSPVALDLDGDDDLEIACITNNGTVYVWDFSSQFPTGDEFYIYWMQPLANALNQNRVSLVVLTRIADQMVVGPPIELLPADKVYCWPNPNIEDYTFIRYRLGASASVNIKIYDLAGDLVEVLPATGYGETDNEVRWDLQNVQSGVYFARIEAVGAGQKAVRIIKIAVVK